jgi:hypothetical protein
MLQDHQKPTGPPAASAPARQEHWAPGQRSHRRSPPRAEPQVAHPGPESNLWHRPPPSETVEPGSNESATATHRPRQPDQPAPAPAAPAAPAHYPAQDPPQPPTNPTTPHPKDSPQVPQRTSQRPPTATTKPSWPYPSAAETNASPHPCREQPDVPPQSPLTSRSQRHAARAHETLSNRPPAAKTNGSTLEISTTPRPGVTEALPNGRQAFLRITADGKDPPNWIGCHLSVQQTP